MAETKKGPIRVRVVLESRSPILMNPMTREVLEALAGIGAAPSQDKDQSAEWRANKKIIKNEDGKVGIPVEYFLGSLKGGGRQVKNGKKTISTATSTTIFDLLDIKGDFFPFINQEEKMAVDMRRGVLNNAGKSVAVAIIRPRFNNWKVEMEISFDPAKITEKVVRELIDTAGGKVGIGDFRPSKNGPFGRYQIADWSMLPEAEAT